MTPHSRDRSPSSRGGGRRGGAVAGRVRAEPARPPAGRLPRQRRRPAPRRTPPGAAAGGRAGQAAGARPRPPPAARAGARGASGPTPARRPPPTTCTGRSTSRAARSTRPPRAARPTCAWPATCSASARPAACGSTWTPSRRPPRPPGASDDPAAYWAAVELYAGDLLPEDAYEDWAAARREALRQEHVALLLALAELPPRRGASRSGRSRRCSGRWPASRRTRRPTGPDAAATPRRARATRRSGSTSSCARRWRATWTPPRTPASQRLYAEIVAHRAAEAVAAEAGTPAR